MDCVYGFSVGLRERAKILVVDDDAQMREHLRTMLEQEGYAVDLVEDGRQALRRVEVDRPDLVLLDVIMPGMGGLEVLRFLKNPKDMRFLPVILLTADTDLETRLRGLKLGADDYLTKPANSREVLARIEALLRIKRLQDQIAASRSQLEDVSLTDAVTGLYNPKYLRLRLRDEFKRAERYNEPLSCIQVVIEGYAQLRAKLDAEQLVELLAEMAAILRAGVREFDVVVRNGDDRFVILLPRTHFSGSMAVSSRLWETLRAQRVHWPGRAKKLEICVGVAFYPDKDVSTAEQLIHKVDRAVERARKEGTGQICLFQQTAYLYRPDQGK